MTEEEHEWLAERFDAERRHLRAVAYRMLGSVAEADDAVQEAWLRLSRSDTSGIENLGAWLTTVVARVCLSALRARKARQEEPLGPHLPEPIVSRDDQLDPEEEALRSVFDEMAPHRGTVAAPARQLASRARRRVRGAAVPDADLSLLLRASPSRRTQHW